MASIGTVYSKQGKELDIKVNKTFLVPPEHIFIEEGFNIRELDQDHIDSIAAAYSDGLPVPAIVVQTVGNRFKIIDGAHRYTAAVSAGVLRLECKEFSGNAQDMVALMVTSSQGRNLTPMERAKAYTRLKNFGMTHDEIALKVNRSRVDIDNHLILLSAPNDVQEAVKKGEIAYSTVVTQLRSKSGKGEEKLSKAVATAKTTGAKKAVVEKFTKKDFTEVLEILAAEPSEDWKELLSPLIAKYISVEGS
jgi:ParB family chromosome partitioning protein